MKEKISRINRVHHPNTTPENRTQQLEAWMMMVHDGMEHCKREHENLLREATTRMELAAWKIYLNENEAISTEHVAKKAKLTNAVDNAEREVNLQSDPDPNLPSAVIRGVQRRPYLDRYEHMNTQDVPRETMEAMAANGDKLKGEAATYERHGIAHITGEYLTMDRSENL